jgi:pimeloyl-ACP methyl ester carboxylesterase
VEHLVHRVSVPGGELYVTSDGRAGSYPAVIALHGGPGIDGGGLRLMLGPLMAMTKVVVPDLRGHGRSDYGSPADWNLDTWADDLAVVTDELGLDAPLIFGISFGGWVAIRYAGRHARQSSGLVVAATAARLPPVEQVARRMGELGGLAAEAAWLRLHAEPPDSAGARQWCDPLMSRRRPRSDLAAIRLEQQFHEEVDAHFTPFFQQLDLSSDLGRYRCPGLVIVGQHDPMVPVESAAATAAAFGSGPAALKVFPDAAHDLLADAPDELIDAIRQMLGQLQSANGSDGRWGPRSSGR